jgi:hypothetical protein
LLLDNKVTNIKNPAQQEAFDMFGDTFSKSRLQKQLLLLNAVTGFVSAASEASALDRCPDYVAKHGGLYREFFVHRF